MKRVKLNTSVDQDTYRSLDKIAGKLLMGTKQGWVKGRASKGRAIDYLVQKEIAGSEPKGSSEVR
jgi:hypothetical protein